MNGGYFRLYYRKCPYCGEYQDVIEKILINVPKDGLIWKCEECGKDFMVKIIIEDKIME